MEEMLVAKNLNKRKTEDSIRLKSNIYEAYTEYIEYLSTCLSDNKSIRENLEIKIEIGEMIRERKKFESENKTFNRSDSLPNNIGAVISSIGQELANYKPSFDTEPFHDNMKYLSSLEALEDYDDIIKESFGAPQKVKK